MAPLTYQGDLYPERIGDECIYWQWNESMQQVLIHANGVNTTETVPGYEYGFTAACPDDYYGGETPGGVAGGTGTGNGTGGLFFGFPGLGLFGNGHGPDFGALRNWLNQNQNSIKWLLIIVAAIIAIIFLSKK